MLTADAEELLDRIAVLVLARVESHEGRLSWMRVLCPRPFVDEMTAALPARLADHGLDFIDIDVEPCDGEPSIDAMGWQPGQL